MIKNHIKEYVIIEKSVISKKKTIKDLKRLE